MEYKPVFKKLPGSHIPLLLHLKTPLCKRASRREIDSPSRRVGSLGWGPAPSKRMVPRISFPLMGSPKDGWEMYALQEVLGPLMYGYVWLFVLCFDFFLFLYIYIRIYLLSWLCKAASSDLVFLDTVCLHGACDMD